MPRIVVLLLLIAAAAVPSSIGAQVGRSQPPNVVLIITDDVGYGDFGSYGAPDVKTPTLTVWPVTASD